MARTEEEKAASREEQLGRLGINKPGKSLNEIAAMMEANRQQMQGEEPRRRPVARRHTPEQQPNEVETEEDEPEDSEDEEEVNDESREEEGTSETGEDEEESGDGEEDESDDEESDDEREFAELDLDDEDLIEIEGIDEPVSFKTLKDVYNADKTVVEKVQRAEEQYSNAYKVAQTATTQADEMQSAMKELVSGLESALMQPLISKPDESLKQTDPGRYIQHYEAYQNDQERIKDTREQIMKALDTHASKSKETKEQLRAAELNRLVQKLPPLRNESTKKQASQDILKAAEHYGFSPEEVNSSADHRVFLMAYDAMQYRKLKGMSSEEREERTTKVRKQIGSQPSVMRSKGTNKSRVSSAQKRLKVYKTKAQKSGKTDDVANFMAASRAARSRAT